MDGQPKINRKLFQKVYDKIVTSPSLHDQADWEMNGDEECGTTRCVGGWALVIHTGKSDVLSAAREVIGYNHVSVAAEEVLGLNFHEAHWLFYGVTNTQAVELCRRYATGGRASANRFITFIDR